MTSSAYAQLRDLMGREDSTPLWSPPGPVLSGSAAPGDGTRPAAVLILFGVLDDVPAEHHAAAVPRDLDLLLLTRATTLRSHPGQVAFPGGRVDPDDADAVDAALREAREETGIDTDGVEVLGALAELALPHSRHRVTPVVGWWRSPSPFRVVDVAESQAVFRAPVADLVDPKNRVTWTLRGSRGPAWNLMADGKPQFLWGFTAGIVDALLTKLDWAEPWDRTREVEVSPGPPPSAQAFAERT